MYTSGPRCNNDSIGEHFGYCRPNAVIYTHYEVCGACPVFTCGFLPPTVSPFSVSQIDLLIRIMVELANRLSYTGLGVQHWLQDIERDKTIEVIKAIISMDKT